MLKLLRHKRVAKVVLWAILILILPAFVIWGTGSLGRSKDKGPSYVGLINNKKVTFDAFADSLACMKAQILMNFYNQQQVLDTLLKNKEFMGKMAWDRLIMASQAKQQKIRVSDSEVITFIRNMPIFSRGGRFDDRIYGYVLRNNLGLSPRSFEEMMRENLKSQKLNAGLTKDVKVSDGEVLSQYKADNEKFKVSYVILAEDAEKTYQNILNTMVTENMAFEAAAAKIGLKAQETPLFSKSDYLEGLGEALQLTDAAAKLKIGDLSGLVQTRKGMAIFKLLEIQNFDEEKFKKEKEEYAKKVLAAEKNKFLEEWLKDLESKNLLNIDLKDYEKYYQ